jgi:hypothetical protein
MSEEGAPFLLMSLPPGLLARILRFLPIDARLLASAVCRAWRAELAAPSMWTTLDMSDEAGLARTASWQLLRAAAARADGRLRSLSLSGVIEGDERSAYDSPDTQICYHTLRARVQENGGTLRELRVGGVWPFSLGSVQALLQDAPALRSLRAYITCDDAEDMTRMLRRVPPFEPLLVEALEAFTTGVDGVLDVGAFVADVAASASLTSLALDNVLLTDPAHMGTLVDAAITRRMTTLRLQNSGALNNACLPALARLLREGALTTLTIIDDTDTAADLDDVPAATALGAALRANATLTHFTLHQPSIMSTPAAAAPIFAALAGHPSLTYLDVSSCLVFAEDEDGALKAAAGAVIGAIVAANAPALTELNISWCHLGDAGLAPLFAALPTNTHLRSLDCAFNNPSAAFAADVLLPAVRANASLTGLNSNSPTELDLPEFPAVPDGLKAAMALVLERTAAASAGSAPDTGDDAGPSDAR